MAFNFSKIEISHHASPRKAPLQEKPQREPGRSSAARA
jgi:hypothetical protein